MVGYAKVISDARWETNDLSRRQHVSYILKGASNANKATIHGVNEDTVLSCHEHTETKRATTKLSSGGQEEGEIC